MVFTKEDLMDGRVCGWEGGGGWDRRRRTRTQNGSCRRREMAVPRFPRFPRHACSQASAARGPGSDRGASRFARNFVVMPRWAR